MLKRIVSLSFNFEALDEIGLSGKVDVADLILLCYVYMARTAKGPISPVKLTRELLADFTPYAVLKETDGFANRLEDLKASGILSVVTHGDGYEVSLDAGFFEKCSTLGVFSAWEKDPSRGNTSFGQYTVPAENLLQQQQYSEAIRFIEKYILFDASLSEPSQLSAFLDFCAGIIQAETEANGMESGSATGGSGSATGGTGRFSVYDPRALKETRAVVSILLNSIKAISPLLDEGHHRLNADQLRELLFEYVKAACGHYASIGIKRVSPLLLASVEAAGAFGESIDDYSPVEGRRYFVKFALGLES
ncbi:MAG: hypothetical protein HQK89_13040 [Nitrospirae bacterium]|nr:hypothetical protein [Nitrospirota bacterium]